MTDRTQPAGLEPTGPEDSLSDPALRPFLPLIYIAWADGDLSDDEIRAICVELHASAPGEPGVPNQPGEETEDDRRTALGRWLDPTSPPTATELARLLREVRKMAGDLDHDERRTLTGLGLAIARAGGREPTAAETRALEQLETALGVVGHEASRRLLSARRPRGDGAAPAPTFDIDALQSILDQPNRGTRRELRRVLAGDEFGYRYDLGKDAYRDQVLTWCRRLAAAGYGGLGFPATYGGGDDPGGFLAAFETLASHDLSLLVKFGVQFGLFAGSIQQLGTSRHHETYLAAAASLDLPGCFAMTETGHGSNVAEIETTATYDSETSQFVLETPNEEARKDYIGNAARHGRLATVFAQLIVDGEEHGVHALLVPIRDETGKPVPGVRIEDCGEKLGLNGVDNGRLWFDGVAVPRANLLDRFASVSGDGVYSSPIASPAKRFFTMLGTLVGGRVSVALASLAATKSALTIAIRYAERRRQFGPSGDAEITLLDYQTHQRRLLPRLARTYALHFALRHLADRYLHDGENRRELEGIAAGLKSMATWHATDTIQECREACGGQGYLAVNRLAALKADTDVFTTFEGDNTVLLQLLGKGLLSSYRKQFGDMNFLDMLRFAATQAGTLVSELNPVVTRNTDVNHLRSNDFQADALHWRERHLLSTVARRLRRRLKNGTDSFRALIECQNHVVALAKAHTEHLVLTRFRAALAEIEDLELVAVLEPLADLYALACIESHRGWYLEHGYLEAVKAKAIRKEVEALCLEIRPRALSLVDAFGIPDELLGAPIAR